MKKISFKCCLCGKDSDGYGNNPWPLNNEKDARCCDECNSKYIIAARLAFLYSCENAMKGENK